MMPSIEMLAQIDAQQKTIKSQAKEIERLMKFKDSVLSNTTQEILNLYYEMQKWDELLKPTEGD
jgi:nitrogen fixation/metabolism regulation signal transduction histidine kinase